MSNESRYFSIELSKFKLDGGAMFGIIPKPLWSRQYPADQQNRISLALRLLLIQTENKNILIDTGIGQDNREKFNQVFAIEHFADTFDDILSAINLKTHDITDLVMSHLHFDHAGGMLTDNKPTFKNAVLHLHQTHFEYAKNSNMRDRGSFHPDTFLTAIKYYRKKDQLHFLKNKNGIILTDKNYQLNYRCSHGHTPFMIHPYDLKVIYLADLIPTSKHIPLPWVMGYDMQPGKIVQEKKEILEFILKYKLKMIFEHDKDLIGSEIEMNDGKISLKEIINTNNKQACNPILF